MNRRWLTVLAVAVATLLAHSDNSLGDDEKTTESSDHWAFQPVRRRVPPSVTNLDWPRNQIDRFVLARLEHLGIAPSPPADRYTLLRRLSLDLTGLPPTPEEIGEFVNNKRPDANERLVDRLLASPHFGERWGRHWLDLARYADSDGYEMDHPRPHAWRWRDWVIDAINRDMPFDQFTIEQLAGDLLPAATLQQKIATGFHRNTLTNRENGIDKEEFRIKAVVDRVNTTGTVWLGLTIACAECHDHKYDPIAQQEYYRLFAFFNDRVDEHDIPLPASASAVAAFEREQAAHNRKVEQLDSQLADAKPNQRDSLGEQIQQLKKLAPEPPRQVAHAMTRRGKPRTTRIHLSGNFLNKGARVTAGTPRVLHAFRSRGSGTRPDRLDLARWIVDPANPLCARVEANRLWQHLFGVGLVTTPEDFGRQGEQPSHPELLDWLATELMRKGWSRKAAIRQIVLSATYRQSSAYRRDLSAVDPSNRLLARQNRYRLEAELVRDQYLATSGLLNHRIGGPGFRPPLTKRLSDIGFRVAWIPDSRAELHRRGMYIFFQRNLMYPTLMTFDHPRSNVTCTRRERSNTPLQALTLLNHPTFVEAARALAGRVLREAGSNTAARIDRMFLFCLARPPNDEERRVLVDLYHRMHDIHHNDRESARALLGGFQLHRIDDTEIAAWIAVARTVMNLDEFITRE